MHGLDHAPKPFSADDLLKPNRFPLGHGRLLTRGPMVSMRVRAGLVIVLYEFTNQVVEMILAEGNEMVEAQKRGREQFPSKAGEAC
jgi:hypothetical protein